MELSTWLFKSSTILHLFCYERFYNSEYGDGFCQAYCWTIGPLLFIGQGIVKYEVVSLPKNITGEA